MGRRRWWVLVAVVGLLAGCGGSDDKPASPAKLLAQGKLSARDTVLVAKLKTDRTEFQKVSAEIEARLNDDTLTEAQFGRITADAVRRLKATAARLVDAASQIENTALRSLMLPSTRDYVREAADSGALVLAYAHQDIVQIQALTKRISKAEAAFAKAQLARVRTLRPGLSSDEYQVLLASVRSAGLGDPGTP